MFSQTQAGLYRQIFAFILGPLLCFIIKDMSPFPGMAPEGMKCLAGCVWLLVWWVSEVFSMPVTSIMSIPIFSLLGVLPPAKIFAAMGHPAAMLVFGATIIVGLLKESNLIERYAYWCLNLSFVRGSVARLVFVFALSAGIMSSIAPNIPLSILFVSIAVTIGRSCQLSKESGVMRALIVLSGVAPAVGGAGTPIGGAPNMVVIALIATTLNHELSFWEWSAIGLPMALLQLVIMFVLCWLIFPLSGAKNQVPLPESHLREKLEKLGPVSRHEHIAIIVIGVALFLWCTGPQLAGLIGWEAGVKLMRAPFVAILVGAATFIIPLRRSETTGKYSYAMNWEQAVRNIGWAILVIQVGTITFGDVLLKGGVDKWAAGLIQSMLGDISGTLVWFCLVVFTGLASQIVTNVALVALMLPITAGLAAVYGFNPLAACLSVGFACNVATMFPFSSLSVAAAMMGGEEFVKPKDFMLLGLLTTLAVSSTAFLFCYLMGPMVLPLIVL
ncbi:SLC13 family permease [Desulfovibrio sp. OttesenSCG-928-C14]|nr:SLC13 family permease [Desulfovibrio sp. OttesenSCG-928-C14]